MMDAPHIKELIEKSLPDTIAQIEGDDGRHFNAVVISPLFAGKNRVEKQQLVYSTLGNHITDGTIHAISIKTFTPEEWRELNKGS
jgi:acid stress-induced BolA-like protein IbaG/YrbA